MSGEGRVPREEYERPFESWPLNGMACSACGLPQRTTPGGAACAASDHGGAEGVPIIPKDAPESRFILLDLETTGFDPLVDRILEIGVAVVSSDLDYRMSVGRDERDGMLFQRFPQYGNDRVLGPDELFEGASPPREGYVSARELHEKSGLLADYESIGVADGFSLAEVEAQLIIWLKNGHRFAPRTGVITGNSIWFDRGFIAHQMPALHTFLHYRQMDVSSIREAFIRWIDPDFAAFWKATHGVSKHRVRDDIRSCVDELRHFRAKAFTK